MTSMLSLGHEVHFLHIEKEAGDRDAMRACWGDRYHSLSYRMPENRSSKARRKVCKWLGSEGQYLYGIDEWYDPTANEFIRALAAKIGFDAVIAEYVFFSGALRCFGDGVLKLLDTHDAFTDRHRRYLAEGKKPLWFSTSRQEEARGLERADVVIAIQDNEARHFREISHRRVITVGHIVPLDGVRGDEAKTAGMLYVGSGNEINVHAAKYFIDGILPGIRKHIPSATLTVAGGVCEKLADIPGVRLLGQVDDLAPLYRSAAVVVNPILFGTGLKIKTVEALGFGRSLVTTPAGAEGLEGVAGKAFMMADSEPAFSSAVITLLSDPGARRVLAENARECAAEWNRRCLSELAAVLNSPPSGAPD
ncbi:MAG: glycosyltransferase [Gammaproteobacteria bacterium]|nr:glycosyltransferase [Gammaproteobacteria bacterium]